MTESNLNNRGWSDVGRPLSLPWLSLCSQEAAAVPVTSRYNHVQSRKEGAWVSGFVGQNPGTCEPVAGRRLEGLGVA